MFSSGYTQELNTVMCIQLSWVEYMSVYSTQPIEWIFTHSTQLNLMHQLYFTQLNWVEQNAYSYSPQDWFQVGCLTAFVIIQMITRVKDVFKLKGEMWASRRGLRQEASATEIRNFMTIGWVTAHLCLVCFRALLLHHFGKLFKVDCSVTVEIWLHDKLQYLVLGGVLTNGPHDQQ